MIEDLVLDTHILTEFLSQYYSKQIYSIQGGLTEENNLLSESISRKLNSIISLYREEESLYKGMVIASCLSFIEIARKFDQVSKGGYTVYQLKSFIESPPEWFVIADLDESLWESLCRIPKHVFIGTEAKGIEWPDAIQCATALSRDTAILATKDARITKIELVKCC